MHLKNHRVLIGKMHRNKIISFPVRHEFIIPVVYETGSTEEIEEALVIGALIQQSVRTKLVIVPFSTPLITYRNFIEKL